MRVSGSSEAADHLRAMLRMTMVELQNSYMKIHKDMLRLQSINHNGSLGIVIKVQQDVYKKLNKMIEEIRVVDKKLKAYSLFISEIEHKIQNNFNSSQMSYMSSGPQHMQTLQLWHKKEEGKYVFDSPEELANNLDIEQGKTGLHGSCGICSVENVIRIAGGDATEDSVFQCAYNAEEGALCGKDGGTTNEERKAILSKYGIDSELQEPTIENIMSAIGSGKIVILSVDAGKLYNRHSLRRQFHAVVVTSIAVNEKGEVTEITICDSNAKAKRETGARNYSVEKIKKALTNRKMNVTRSLR